MNRTRRTLLLSTAVLPAWIGSAAGAAGSDRLPQPDDLDAVLARARRERKAVVAVFTRHDCAFCIALKREHLYGLDREAAARRVIVVEIDVGSSTPLTVQGATTSRSAFARRYDGQLTPTVVFLGPELGELAPRLVGYGARDFYTAYLDDRIARSLAAIDRGAAGA